MCAVTKGELKTEKSFLDTPSLICPIRQSSSFIAIIGGGTDEK